MSDLEHQLRVELDTVSDGVATTSVDVSGLTGLGRREQRRRRGAAAGLVAAVAVAVTAVGVAVVPARDRGVAPAAPITTPPATVADLPVGGPTDVAWWSGGALHVGSQDIGMPRPELLLQRGGTTLVETAEGHLVVRVGRAPVDLPTGPYSGDFVVSADGARIAWIERLEPPLPRRRDRRGAPLPTVRVAVYDVASATVLDTYERTLVAFCCKDGGDLSLNGVLADGRVLMTTYGTAVEEVWTPGSEPTVVDLPEGTELDSGKSPSPTQAILGTGLDDNLVAEFTGDGRVDVVGSVGAGAGDWSPDGRFWVATAFNDVRVEAPGEPQSADVLLPLPQDHAWRPVAWESDTELVLVSTPRGSASRTLFEPVVADLVRCDVVAATCEQVGGAPSGPVVVPEPLAYG